MATVYDIPANELIDRVASKLKEIEELTPPEYSKYVKTGVHKDRAPEQRDWWYIRAASLLRRIYMDGPVGIERLRVFYGGKKNRGSKKSQFRRGSGSIIRDMVQQLESAGYVKASSRGRIITPEGRSFMDKTSMELKKELAKEIPALAKY